MLPPLDSKLQRLAVPEEDGWANPMSPDKVREATRSHLDLETATQATLFLKSEYNHQCTKETFRLRLEVPNASCGEEFRSRAECLSPIRDGR